MSTGNRTRTTSATRTSRAVSAATTANTSAADNQAIRLECNICHSIPQVAGPGQPLPPIQQPSVAEPDSHHSTTWLAEHRYKFDATCESCHTVDNPGGSDNSSFCSNSACHATEWKYAGLNAPQVRELSAPPKVPSSGVANPIPHPIGPTTDCKICHGPDKVKPFPENHTAFTPDMCATLPSVDAEGRGNGAKRRAGHPSSVGGDGRVPDLSRAGGRQAGARKPCSLHARYVQQLP